MPGGRVWREIPGARRLESRGEEDGVSGGQIGREILAGHMTKFFWLQIWRLADVASRLESSGEEDRVAAGERGKDAPAEGGQLRTRAAPAGKVLLS